MLSGRLTADVARETDIARILELNKEEYGPGDVLTTHDDFVWRHTLNPAGVATVPVLRDDKSIVVGFISVVPVRIRIKGRDYLAAMGTNLVIHPDYRRAFGYTKLMRKFHQVFKEKTIPLHFSFVSETTYQQQLERAPQSTTTVPLLIKVFDFRNLARQHFGRGWISFASGSAGRLISPFLFNRPLVRDDDVQIRIVDRFDDQFDEFWLAVRDKYPAMVVRERAFLAWRFAPIASRRYQILVAIGKDDHMLGYAVVRTATVRGVQTGLVVDFMVSDNNQGERAANRLVTEIESYFRSREVAVAVVLMSSVAREYKLLRQTGYQRLPAPLSPRLFRFAFYLHTQEEKDLLSLSTQDWFITLADYEAF